MFVTLIVSVTTTMTVTVTYRGTELTWRDRDVAVTVTTHRILEFT